MIPRYCAGSLYRTGPGKYAIETEEGKSVAVSHWFDGFAQVHRFQIVPSADPRDPMKVFYNSRFTTDEMMNTVRRTGKLDAFTFGQKRDPCENLFQKVASFFKPIRDLEDGSPDSHNIGVSISANVPGMRSVSLDRTLEQGGSSESPPPLVNSTDANHYQFLHPETLEPSGLTSQKKLHAALRGPLRATHSRTDPTTGDVFNYNLDLGRTSTYRVFRTLSSSGVTSVLATITDAPPAYVHSIFLTQNCVILCVWGAHYSMYGLKMFYTHNVIDALNPLDPTQRSRWYVIDRSPLGRGLMAVYTSDAFFAFHTVNAYEEESKTRGGQVDILADVACYDDLSILKSFYYEQLISSSFEGPDYAKKRDESSRPWLARFRLPNILDSGSQPREDETTVAVREWAAARHESVELPALNPFCMTKRHRYIYGVTDRGLSSFVDGVGKFDCETQKSLIWSQKGHTPAEPIFMPDPDKGEEDEDAGILLVVVLDGYQEKSYLLVLDAKTMREMGRADVGQSVAFGFHGIHVPGHRGADGNRASSLSPT